MYTYAIWVDLADTSQDREFCEAVDRFLTWYQKQGTVQGYQIQRRTFGFGPESLGEFFIQIKTKSLADLEIALLSTTPRLGELEELHVEVFKRVTNFRSALYRTFPDENRVR